MSTTPLSPDQVKSISAEIRSTEIARLGVKLPNTTALNAITRALGLGADFRAFKAAYEKSHACEPQVVTRSNLILAFENEYVDMALCDAKTEAKILTVIRMAGFQGEITTGRHGVSFIMAWSEGDQHRESDLIALKARLLALQAQLIADGELGAFKGAIHYQMTSDNTELTVDFLYHDNDQVCSASVSEAAWSARHMLDQDDEFCLLLLYRDIEIESHYTPDDITVQDVIVDVARWDGE